MITRILVLLLILLLFPIWSIDRFLLRKNGKNIIRILFCFPNILLAILISITAYNESYTEVSDAWKGLLLSSIVILGIPELIFSLLLYLLLLVRKKKKLFKASIILGFSLSLFAFGILLYGFTMGTKRISIKAVDYTHSNIPISYDNYKIVFISDLHLGTYHYHSNIVNDIVNHINKLHPDLVIFGGDLVNYTSHEAAPFIKTLHEIQAKDGIISIMGNHDYMTYYHWKTPEDSIKDIAKLQAYERMMGWKLLLNEPFILKKNNDSLVLIGLENEGNRPKFPKEADLSKATQGISPNSFCIVLQHDPTYWKNVIIPQTNFPLTLSGHTHAMQFKVGNWSPAEWFYPQWDGFYHDKEQSLFVSPGIGEVLLPFRWGAWPEIDLITLHKSH